MDEEKMLLYDVQKGGGGSVNPFEKIMIEIFAADIKKDQKADYKWQVVERICSNSFSVPIAPATRRAFFEHPRSKDQLMNDIFQITVQTDGGDLTVPAANTYNYFNNMQPGTYGIITILQTLEQYTFRVFNSYGTRDGAGNFTTLSEIRDFLNLAPGVRFSRVVDTSRKSFLFTAKYPGASETPATAATTNDPCGKPNLDSVWKNIQKLPGGDQVDIYNNFAAGYKWERVPADNSRVTIEYPPYRHGVNTTGRARFCSSRHVELYLDGVEDEAKGIPRVSMAFVNSDRLLTRIPGKANVAGAFSKFVVGIKKTDPVLAAMSDDELRAMMFIAKHHGDIGQALEKYRDYDIQGREGELVRVDGSYLRFSEWYDMNPAMKSALESTDGIIIHPWPAGVAESDDEDDDKPIILMIKSSLYNPGQNAAKSLQKLRDEVLELGESVSLHYENYRVAKNALDRQKTALINELETLLALQAAPTVAPSDSALNNSYKELLDKVSKLTTILDYFPAEPLLDAPAVNPRDSLIAPGLVSGPNPAKHYPAYPPSSPDFTDAVAIDAYSLDYKTELYRLRAEYQKYLQSVQIPTIVFKQNEVVTGLSDIFVQATVGGVTNYTGIRYDRINIERTIVGGFAQGRKKFTDFWKLIEIPRVLRRYINPKAASQAWSSTVGLPLLMKIKKSLQRFAVIPPFVQKLINMFQTKENVQKEFLFNALVLCGFGSIDEIAVTYGANIGLGGGQKTRRQRGGVSMVANPQANQYPFNKVYQPPVLQSRFPPVTQKKANRSVKPIKRQNFKIKGELNKFFSNRNDLQMSYKIPGVKEPLRVSMNSYLNMLSDFVKYQSHYQKFVNSVLKAKSEKEKTVLIDEHFNTGYPWNPQEGGAQFMFGAPAAVVEEDHGLRFTCSTLCCWDVDEDVVEINKANIELLISQFETIEGLRESDARQERLLQIQEELAEAEADFISSQSCSINYTNMKEEYQSEAIPELYVEAQQEQQQEQQQQQAYVQPQAQQQQQQQGYAAAVGFSVPAFPPPPPGYGRRRNSRGRYATVRKRRDYIPPGKRSFIRSPEGSSWSRHSREHREARARNRNYSRSRNRPKSMSARRRRSRSREYGYRSRSRSRGSRSRSRGRGRGSGRGSGMRGYGGRGGGKLHGLRKAYLRIINAKKSEET